MTTGKAGGSNMLTHATVRSRIDEKREADGQNRDFMPYFTLITKYLIEVAVRKG